MVETIYTVDSFDIPESCEIHSQGNKESASIVILLHQTDYSSQGDLLHKILNAINVDMQNEVLLLLLEQTDSCQLHNYITTNTRQVLSFGLGIKALGLNAKFVANQFYKTETYSIMLTHSLTKLSTDTQKKKALWSALQKVFVSK